MFLNISKDSERFDKILEGFIKFLKGFINHYKKQNRAYVSILAQVQSGYICQEILFTILQNISGFQPWWAFGEMCVLAA